MGLWIKICGITREEDARFVERSGADAIGLVFSEKSPRFVTPETAKAICFSLSETIQKVGVFVLPDWSKMGEILSQVPLDVIQWHGGPLDREGFGRLADFGLPWIYAVRWSGAGALPNPPTASRLLVEGRVDTAPGGTGQSWDYGRLSQVALPLPLILSGGLSPETVGAALKELKETPLVGVDVSTGVEKSPGIKDERKIRDFVQSVRDWERRS